MKISLKILSLFSIAVKAANSTESNIKIQYNIVSNEIDQKYSSQQISTQIQNTSNKCCEYLFIVRANSTLYSNCYIDILSKHFKLCSLMSCPKDVNRFVFVLAPAIENGIFPMLVEFVQKHSFYTEKIDALYSYLN